MERDKAYFLNLKFHCRLQQRFLKWKVIDSLLRSPSPLSEMLLVALDNVQWAEFYSVLQPVKPMDPHVV